MAPILISFSRSVVSIPVEAKGSLQLVSLYGEKGAVEMKDGAISLALSGAPQYVTVSAGK